MDKYRVRESVCTASIGQQIYERFISFTPFSSICKKLHKNDYHLSIIFDFFHFLELPML